MNATVRNVESRAQGSNLGLEVIVLTMVLISALALFVL